MKFKNLFLALMFCFLLSALIYSCSKSGSSASQATGGTTGTIVSVDMNGMSFTPSNVTVKVGTSVKWTNSDAYSTHTATSNDGTSFNSGTLASGSSYSFKPTSVGSFPYHCLVHGTSMSGTLTVTY